MTKVYIVPWLLMMSSATLVASWLYGSKNDHAEYLLFMAVGFAIYDCLKWCVLRAFKKAEST